MRKIAGIALIISFSIIWLTACKTDNTKHIDSQDLVTEKEEQNESTTPKIEIRPQVITEPNISNSDQSKDIKDYSKLGMHLANETIIGILGGDSPENAVSTLGEPFTKKNMSEYDRWYFEQGIEIDIVRVSDIKTLSNYVYISNTSHIKTNRNIGIGSSRSDVLQAYEKEINSTLTNGERIIVGEEEAGIIFIMNEGKVDSIYIATGAYTMDVDPPVNSREKL